MSENIETEACPDHIHMLAKILPKYSISSFMEYLKSKSILMIFVRYAHLKYKYENCKFGAKGYCVDMVEKREKNQRVSQQ